MVKLGICWPMSIHWWWRVAPGGNKPLEDESHPSCGISMSHEASLVAQMVKNLPAMQEAWVWSLGQEGPLEKGIATHSSILGWRTPWTEEPASPRGRRESDATEQLTLALPSKVKNRRHLIHVHPSYIYVYFTVYAYLWVYEKLLNSICKYILSFHDTACL